MQQHPIPQNVTAYEFHLIGNMTVKQFLELGAGVGIAFIIYNMALPGFVKWPLIAIAVIFGAALAFLPFDGRPLDRMIIVFFRAIYSPTQYIWRKTPHVPTYFNFTPRIIKEDTAYTERQRIKKNLGEYLSTLPDEDHPDRFEQEEDARLASLTNLMQSVQPAEGVKQSTTTIIMPQSPKPRIRAMRHEADVAKKKPAEYTPLGGSTPPLHITNIDAAADVILPPTYQSLQPSPSLPTPNPVIIQPSPTLNLTTPKPPSPPPLPNIPASQPVAVSSTTSKPKTAAKLTPPATSTTAHPTSTTKPPSPTPSDTPSPHTTQATTSSNLPIPEPPKTPNTVSGMVLDSSHKLVTDAIIEIRDHNRMPVRALKTNQLGQFFSATPLSDGTYQLDVEKPGLTFTTQTLTLTGSIIKPLEITAQG